MARSPRKRNQIEEALASLRRGSPIVEGIRSIPARPTLSDALAQPIYDRPSNVPEVTAGQRTAKRTLGERFEQNRQDALQRGIAAALQRSVDAPGFDPATERNRREAYDLLSANDPFYADSNPRLAALATGAGQLVGAMQDPTSFIAPGRTILGRAVGGAGVGGATDVIAQALDIGSGVVDQYNPLQTAGATVAPALLSLGGDALARAGRGAPEAAASEPIAPEPLAPVQPRRRGPSVFDYTAYEAANPMPRPFESAPNLPPPRTYEEAVDQVQSLQAQLNEAYRDVGRSTSVQNPGVSGMRSLDRRAVLERQLAAARTELERLRPAAPERQNAPGTSEAARAILEKHGMGNLMTPGSTRRGPGGVSSFGAFELERMLTGKKGPEVVRDAGRVGYAGQAPGEAVEYLAAAAKGLPMDNASRMQRARDLGFNINRILYHGTKSREPLTEFKRRGSGRQGSFGVWFSDERDVANKYASADDRVGEFYVRGNLLDLTDFSPEGVEQLRKAWQYLEPSYGPEFQILADYTGAESAFDAFVNRVYGGDIWKQGNTLDFQNDLLDALASDVQGVVLADSMEGVPNRSFVVFDPANIRSVHAAFDPDAADSSNLLAGISGLAAPAAGLGAAGAMAAGALSSPEASAGEYGARPDGTQKGQGFLGPLIVRLPDGSTGVATEYSVQSNAVKVNGQRVDFPTLVPTLTAEERRMMLEDIIPNNKPPPETVMQKAIDHARRRIAAGQSPFAD